MNHWKIDPSRAGGPEGFSCAIVGPGKRIVAWVANKRDAQAMIAAERKIGGLASDSARHRRLWFGSMIQRSKVR